MTVMKPDQEIIWLNSLNEDTPYGVYTSDDEAWLCIQPQEFYQQRHRLINEELVLGRVTATDDLSVLRLAVPRIDELGVSRKHAALVALDSGGVGIHDLGSLNGTWLNEMRVKSGIIQPLHHGDVLQMSQLQLTVHFVERETYLAAIYIALRDWFSDEAGQYIDNLDISMACLKELKRVFPPDNPQIVDILRHFYKQGSTVTLEVLEEHISEITESDQHRTTNNLPELDIPEAEQTIAIVDKEFRQRLLATQQQQQTNGNSATHSEDFHSLVGRVTSEIEVLKMALYESMMDADHLSDQNERKLAGQQISGMLKQVNSWLDSLNKLR